MKCKFVSFFLAFLLISSQVLAAHAITIPSELGRLRKAHEGRLDIAERYLKGGKISGEESLDLASDLDMILWGIENPEYYRENREAVLKFDKSRTDRSRNPLSSKDT